MGRERDVRIDAQQPAWLVGPGRDSAFGLFDLADDALRPIEQDLAFGCELEVARRADHQRNAEPFLDPGHQLADRRGGYVERTGGR